MTCKICNKAKKITYFVLASQQETPEKTILLNKKKCRPQSRAAVAAPQLSEQMKVATRKVYDDVRNGIIAQLVTLLTMAKEGIPTIKTGPLLKMQMKNGASFLQNVFVSGRPLYTHHDSIDDMYQSLYQRVMDEVQADRLSSPYTCLKTEGLR